MDDIIEKLSLLDYENAFCKGWKHKRISRVFFAHPPLNEDEETQRIHCLYDMIYWLMSLNKEMVSHFHYIPLSFNQILNYIMFLFLKVFRLRKLAYI